MSEQDDSALTEREREDRAIDAGVAFAGLADSQRGFVVAYLRRDPAEWMYCCGSYCDPCVLTIARAVEKARKELGLGWP